MKEEQICLYINKMNKDLREKIEDKQLEWGTSKTTTVNRVFDEHKEYEIAAMGSR